MGTIADKLTYLGETKSILKDTINMSNANITNSTTFRNYATQLKEGYIDILNNGTDTLYNNFTHLTGKGMTLSFTPTYQAPMKITCYGSTSQASTPTPSSPVDVVNTTGNQSIEICKTNLAYTDWASNFVSRINDNTKAKLETKDTRSCLWYAKNAGYGEYDTKYMFKRKWKENTQYTFAFDIFCVDTVYCNLDIEYTDGTVTELLVGNDDVNVWTHKVATSTSEKTIKYLKPRWRNNSCYIDINTFMVYEGTDTTTPYEAYNGTNYNIGLGDIELCKIGDYEDKIDKSTGKNLFSGEFSQFDSTGGTGTTYAYFKLPDDNESYTLTLIAKKDYSVPDQVGIGFTGNGGNASNGFRWVIFQNKNIPAGQVFTYSTNELRFISMYPANANVLKTITDNFYVQLEKGTRTDYEPYGTDWYLKKNIGKVVLDGSETEWTASSTRGYIINAGINSPFKDKNLSVYLGYCDHFKYITSSNTWVELYGCGFNSSGVFWVREDNNLANSVENWKTWLSTHNTTVYYVLATPTYTKITDSTLIEQLEAIKSKDNITNITSSMVIGAIALKKE